MTSSSQSGPRPRDVTPAPPAFPLETPAQWVAFGGILLLAAAYGRWWSQ